MAPNKPIRNATRLLIAVGGFAAGPGLLAGLKAGLSVADTVKAMWAKAPPALNGLADDLAREAEELFAAWPDRPPDADILFGQMVALGLPSADDIVSCALKPDALCDLMLARLTDPEHLAPPMPGLFRALAGRTLARVLDDPAFTADLTPAFMERVLSDLAALRATAGRLQDRARQDAQRLGIQEGLLIALARRYAETEPEDFDSALRGLDQALQVAADERKKGRLPGNDLAAVDAVFRKVDALNAEGEIDAASAELARLDAEIRDESARLAQARMHLVERRIAQAVMARDVDLAVAMLLDKLDLDGGRFADLQRLQDAWTTRGRDKGLRFDLEVAIGLGRAEVDRADYREERAHGWNDLGVALEALGSRDSDTARLQAALEAWQNAERDWPRDSSAEGWAMVQNNLGIVYQSLGQRAQAPDLLAQSAAHYRLALEVWTRDSHPLDWAKAQSNLGNALCALGQVSRDIDTLREAVDAHRLSLEAYPRAEDPLNWATSMRNLGTALLTLGHIAQDVALTSEAARTLQAALTEIPRETMPMPWAECHENLAWCDLALAVDPATGAPCPHLHQALAHVDQALGVYAADAASYHLDKAYYLRADLLARIAEFCPDAADS